MVRRGMRAQGSGRRGPDGDAMDDAECVRHSRGMLKSRGGGVGRDFWHRPPAVTVRDPAWGLTDQALGVIVDRSKSEGGVRKGAAGHAIGRGAAELVFPGPALGEMQSETACFAGDASGQREEAPSGVLVVATGSPRPMRAIQRARLWAVTCTASQAALTGKWSEG